jgi:hypothetical protein
MLTVKGEALRPCGICLTKTPRTRIETCGCCAGCSKSFYDKFNRKRKRSGRKATGGGSEQKSRSGKSEREKDDREKGERQQIYLDNDLRERVRIGDVSSGGAWWAWCGVVWEGGREC